MLASGGVGASADVLGGQGILNPKPQGAAGGSGAGTKRKAGAGGGGGGGGEGGEVRHITHLGLGFRV